MQTKFLGVTEAAHEVGGHGERICMDNHTNTSTANAAAVRASQDRITKNADLTSRYLEHAVEVEAFTSSLKSSRTGVRAGFAAAGIDYGLARHAVYIAGIVQKFEQTEPRVRDLGPSLLLLLQEASRRFAREGRSSEATDLLGDMLSGVPRSALRAKYLPKKKVAASQPATIANAFERLLASGA